MAAVSSPACVCLQGMQAQNWVWGPAVCTMVAAAANVPITAWLTTAYGFDGAAVANAVSRVLQLLILLGERSDSHHVLLHVTWSSADPL